MKTIELTPPLRKRDIRKLRAGDLVSITGKIVTARDKAYAKVTSGAKIPVNLRGGVVYHCGPLAKQTQGRWKIVSAGPTTSARMDQMQTGFIKRTGVSALIGKGGVGKEIAEKIARLGCVYLAFTGGAGLVASKSIKRVENVFWRELGDPEAMWVLEVKNFGPLVVAIDLHGKNLYSYPK